MKEHEGRYLHILEIVYGNPLTFPGGLEVYSLNLGVGLTDKGYLVDYAFVKDPKLKEILKKEDVSINFNKNTSFIEFNIARFYFYIGLEKLIYSMRLEKFISRNLEKYDVIHFNGDNGGSAGKSFPKLKIMTWHGTSNPLFNRYMDKSNFVLRIRKKMMQRISFMLERRASYYADVVTAVSKQLIPEINKISRKNNVYYTPICVNERSSHLLDKNKNIIKESLGLDVDSIYALFVGKDPVRKGLDVAVRAILASRKIKLIAVTNKVGQYDPLGGRIIFKSSVSIEELNSLYNCCDILVFPSKAEGFPTVVLEAMKVGLVPILFDNVAKNIPEIRNGYNSITVKDEDEFIKAVKSIEDNSTGLLEMSNNAKSSIVKDYGCQRLADDFDKIIRENIRK
ncbi:MAG: glycosyltransferase family 4 protein [Nitrososphaerota archaeon]